MKLKLQTFSRAISNSEIYIPCKMGFDFDAGLGHEILKNISIEI